MDYEGFFTIDGDAIIDLRSSDALPHSFTSILGRHIERLLARRVLTVGAWHDVPSRPDVLALDATGALIAVSIVNPEHVDSAEERVRAVDAYLESLGLRDLSALNDDPVAFYEGLLDLSPDASVVLASERRHVLVTALETIDVDGWLDDLPNTTIELQYFDVVLQSDDSPPVMKRRTPTLGDIARAERSTAPLADVIDLTSAEHPSTHHHHPGELETRSFTLADSISGDDTRMFPVPTVHTPQSTVEVVPPPVDTPAADAPTGSIRQGATFLLERLPILFDPTGTSLTSISDEMFAANDHLIIVEKLPEERRQSPFEERDRFRWDTSRHREQLLDRFVANESGGERTIHLFVEAEQEGNLAVYVGVLERITVGKDATWFSIEPELDADLYRLLRKGKIPESHEHTTIDFHKLDV